MYILQNVVYKKENNDGNKRAWRGLKECTDYWGEYQCVQIAMIRDYMQNLLQAKVIKTIKESNASKSFFFTSRYNHRLENLVSSCPLRFQALYLVAAE